jgi:hypothetical protein
MGGGSMCVLLNGRAPTGDSSDAYAEGRGSADTHRLYQLVRQGAGAGERDPVRKTWRAYLRFHFRLTGTGHWRQAGPRPKMDGGDLLFCPWLMQVCSLC